jgi:hypothetical protein
MTEEEFEQQIKLQQTKVLTRRGIALDRLLELHETSFSEHPFVFTQMILRELSVEQLENLLGALDHGKREN